MKIYTIHLDDYAKERVLDALLFRASQVNKEMRDNIMMVYGDIKEELQNQ